MKIEFMSPALTAYVRREDIFKINCYVFFSPLETECKIYSFLHSKKIKIRVNKKAQYTTIASLL